MSLALGADRRSVMILLLREAAITLGLGLTGGAVLALVAGPAAAALLFRLEPSDPVSLATAGMLVTLVAAVASYLPARRAPGVDAAAALRLDC